MRMEKELSFYSDDCIPYIRLALCVSKDSKQALDSCSCSCSSSFPSSVFLSVIYPLAISFFSGINDIREY